MSVWRQKTSVISNLRVKGGEFDGLMTRLYFERLFGTADLMPSNLPAQAIVCIRNLRDPTPRSLSLNPRNSGNAAAWHKTVTREIENLYRKAFYPIRETIPAQAESIVFADESELLACLAADWIKNSLARRWWWQSLFPDLSHAQTVARIWLESAESVPNALNLLAKQRQAVKFISRLQPNETNDLLRRTLRIFNLDKLQKVIFDPVDELKKPVAANFEKPGAKSENQSRKIIPEIFGHSAPWTQISAETEGLNLSFEGQSLLGISLMLVRAPGFVRTKEFAEQTKLFRIEFETRKSSTKIAARSAVKIVKNPTAQNTKTSPPRKNKNTLFDFSEIETPLKRETEKLPVKFIEDFTGEEKTDDKPDSFEFGKKPEIEFSPKETRKNTTTESKTEPVKKESKQRENHKPKKLKPAGKPFYEQKIFSETDEEAETSPESIVYTAYGGVFYLLNLGLFLNLYRDFTETGEDETDLNIWDFIALTGLEFLGAKFKKDSVWKLLANLAGRENENKFPYLAAKEWRMPPGWLKTFQTNHKWILVKTGKRLIVRHPANFSVLNVRASRDLANDLEIYQKSLTELEELNKVEFSGIRSSNWLKNFCEFARRRLKQALNIESDAQINEILFEGRAKIRLTATHFEIDFSLADLPFEIRLSGLDRDPGWIPAAGKFVYFHYV